MEKIFITDLEIKKVRHLSGIRIPLAEDKIKHLLITGKNGSGKTSLLDAMAEVLNMLTTSDTGTEWIMGHLQKDRFKDVYLELNLPLHDISWIFQKGEFIVAYYKADRVFQTQIPRHVEKVELMILKKSQSWNCFLTRYRMRTLKALLRRETAYAGFKR